MFARMLERTADDLEIIASCLGGDLPPQGARHAAGRVGELVLLARAIAEGETPLRTGARGGSDLVAVSPAEQLVASDAKATLSIRAHSLPATLAASRLGRAWATDPATGMPFLASQGSIPYAGRDADRIGIPIDAAENLPYRFLFVVYRAGAAWGASDWYSVDVRLDPSRRRLYAHDHLEAVSQTLGFDDKSANGLLAALDGTTVDLLNEG